MRIAIVEDHPRVADLVRNALERAGFGADVFDTGAAARTWLQRRDYAALVLDRGLPDGDGLSLLAGLRSAGWSVPCLVLTARDAIHDRVAGLDHGADDYLPKPFEPRELLLRLGNILKRAAPAAGAAMADAPESVHFGPFSFRFDRGELRREDEVVRITEREREILTILGAQAGDNVPREALSGNGAAANERTVDVQINRLRRKIETDPANPIFLQTVRGIGYRLVIDR